jgi:hypothetical protein
MFCNIGIRVHPPVFAEATPGTVDSAQDERAGSHHELTRQSKNIENKHRQANLKNIPQRVSHDGRAARRVPELRTY